MVKKPKREVPGTTTTMVSSVDRHCCTSDNNDGDIYQTENPAVKCTRLPEFIRARKQLDTPFCVYVSAGYVPEGTRLVVFAGNLKNPCAELRNNVTRVCNNVARFDDLRFLGKSGRGTRFNVYMRFESEPVREAVYWNAIKVTVDGPRPPRNNKIQKTTTNRRVQKSQQDDSSSSLNQHIYHNKLNLFKPIKKRYREFVVSASDMLTSSPLVDVALSITNSNLTPPDSPNQHHHHLKSHEMLLTTASCAHSATTPLVLPVQSQPSGSSSNSNSLTLFSPHYSSSTSSPSSVSSSISDLSMSHSSKLDCSLSSSSSSSFLSPLSFDRQSISHFLEVYMDLYKIKSYEGFSNYLADLVQRYLHTNEYNYSRTQRLAGSERFLFNYNAFYQQLMKSDFRNLST